ncbi:MAG TPA: amino acid ABC transporter substrate-binding protein [Verrucomicrobia bacterium]|nr:amino acid ABC transporter substrate-binding protein [Verrucomicrobiota bacterium]
MVNRSYRVVGLSTLLLLPVLLIGCGRDQRQPITSIDQLAKASFAVPTGTVADQLVRSRLPDAQFQYFNSVLDTCLAVNAGKADAAAYDEPILRNIAAKTPGLKVLDDMITVDEYGFAVRLTDDALKVTMDAVLQELKASGEYDRMRSRWLPAKGVPAPMPTFPPIESSEELRFGTAAVTEPFSFVDGSREVVGLDIELAHHIARRLGKKLVVVNMDFGGMIPALASGKVDMIGACITITEERAQRVLFSVPYYKGGIAALVRE